VIDELRGLATQQGFADRCNACKADGLHRSRFPGARKASNSESWLEQLLEVFRDCDRNVDVGILSRQLGYGESARLIPLWSRFGASAVASPLDDRGRAANPATDWQRAWLVANTQ
jgi:hypothetical protein